MESPRRWTWERRVKLLLLVTLVYGFLLSLLEGGLEKVCKAVLRAGCDGIEKRSRATATPRYRLRLALARFWQDHHASPRTHSVRSGYVVVFGHLFPQRVVRQDPAACASSTAPKARSDAFWASESPRIPMIFMRS